METNQMSTTTLTTTARSTTALATGIRAGLIGGAIAGIAFAMFEMVAAGVLNGPDAFFMPLRMIGAIALGTSALDPASSLLTAGAAGLFVHMALSMMYGAVVGALLAGVPAIGGSAASRIGLASAAGFALWVVNFFVLAGIFGWTWFPNSQNVVVQVVAHTMMFGTVLGVVIDRLAFRHAND